MHRFTPAGRAQKFGASILISVQYDQILRDPLFRSIGCACVNLHFALLPRNRGVAPIAWAIVEGDQQTGVTLHQMVEDIDAGDVIAQRAVVIELDDSAREVYDKVAVACVKLFKKSYPFSAGQMSNRVRQNPALASYHRTGQFNFSDKRIQWGWPAIELHRWIRTMIFPPFQYPEFFFDGQTLPVTRISGGIMHNDSAPPGVVLATSIFGIGVAAVDGAIRLCGVIDQSSSSPAAPDGLTRISAGARLT